MSTADNFRYPQPFPFCAGAWADFIDTPATPNLISIHGLTLADAMKLYWLTESITVRVGAAATFSAGNVSLDTGNKNISEKPGGPYTPADRVCAASSPFFTGEVFAPAAEVLDPFGTPSYTDFDFGTLSFFPSSARLFTDDDGYVVVLFSDSEIAGSYFRVTRDASGFDGGSWIDTGVYSEESVSGVDSGLARCRLYADSSIIGDPSVFFVYVIPHYYTFT